MSSTPIESGQRRRLARSRRNHQSDGLDLERAQLAIVLAFPRPVAPTEVHLRAPDGQLSMRPLADQLRRLIMHFRPIGTLAGPTFI